MKRRVFFCLAALLFPMSTASAFAVSQTPQEALDTFHNCLRAMSFPVKDEMRHKELVAQADSFLDLSSMGMLALRGHWTGLAPDERSAFMKLFRQLTEEVAYPRSSEFIGQLRITYPEVKKAERGYEVHTVIHHEDKALNAPVIYFIAKEQDGWKIYDIFLDGISIIEDLQYQFDKIIQDASFQGLLERMREKLRQAHENRGGEPS